MKKPPENAESENQKIDLNGSTNADQQAPDVAGGFLESLRLPQSFREVGVKKLLTHVPLRKPKKHEFVRVHPDHSFETFALDLKDEDGVYVVDRHLRQEVLGLAAPMRFLLTITRQRVLLLWSIRLPGDDGKLNPWHESAAEAAEHAKTCWIRVQANMAAGGYEIFQANGNLSEPEWPEEPFEKILEIAFRGKVIDDYDHPVLRRYRGEI